METPDKTPEANEQSSGLINVAGDTVTQATADLPGDQQAPIRRIYALAKEERWTWADAEQRTGIDSTTLFRVWCGTYIHPQTREPMPLDGVVERLRKFFKRWDARAASENGFFVETSVWRRTHKLCREVFEAHSIGFMFGEGQIGKSYCLKEYGRRYNHGETKYLVAPAGGGMQSLMKGLANACNISVRSSFDSLRERVRAALDPSTLLIVDECHEIFQSYQRGSAVKCFAILRQLQEASQCGMVLCGTNVFRTELERGEYAQAMRQLRRRAIWQIEFEPYPLREDLVSMAAAFRLPEATGEAQSLARAIGKEWGLGKYTKFLIRADALARAKKERLTWAHFIKVISVADAISKPPTED